MNARIRTVPARYFDRRTRRYLGKCRSQVVATWLRLDPTLRGFAPNRREFDILMSDLRNLRAVSCFAYLSGLREFYRKQQ
jgi:hypothetical protein